MNVTIINQISNISGNISFPDNPSPEHGNVTALIASCIRSESMLRCTVNSVPYMIGSEVLRDSVIKFEP